MPMKYGTFLGLLKSCPPGAIVKVYINESGVEYDVESVRHEPIGKDGHSGDEAGTKIFITMNVVV